MRCPSCYLQDTKVIDSRLLQEGDHVRRRRKCEKCGYRFTTYEKIEQQVPAVLKNDGRREEYDREKITSGLQKACQKRPISADQIDNIVNSLEVKMIQSGIKEYPSNMIGPFIMEKLNEIDHVAFVRFASFYWNFDTIDTFVSDLVNKSNYLKTELESQND